MQHIKPLDQLPITREGLARWLSCESTLWQAHRRSWKCHVDGWERNRRTVLAMYFESSAQTMTSTSRCRALGLSRNTTGSKCSWILFTLWYIVMYVQPFFWRASGGRETKIQHGRLCHSRSCNPRTPKATHAHGHSGTWTNNLCLFPGFQERKFNSCPYYGLIKKHTAIISFVTAATLQLKVSVSKLSLLTQAWNQTLGSRCLQRPLQIPT